MQRCNYSDPTVCSSGGWTLRMEPLSSPDNLCWLMIWITPGLCTSVKKRQSAGYSLAAKEHFSLWKLWSKLGILFSGKFPSGKFFFYFDVKTNHSNLPLPQGTQSKTCSQTLFSGRSNRPDVVKGHYPWRNTSLQNQRFIPEHVSVLYQKFCAVFTPGTQLDIWSSVTIGFLFFFFLFSLATLWKVNARARNPQIMFNISWSRRAEFIFDSARGLLAI